MYSAHQMGSCRLSATPEGGPLRETGEAWECDGLFVADASVLPTSLGINPMITVEAVAFMVAEQVLSFLECPLLFLFERNVFVFAARGRFRPVLASCALTTVNYGRHALLYRHAGCHHMVCRLAIYEYASGLSACIFLSRVQRFTFARG